MGHPSAAGGRRFGWRCVAGLDGAVRRQLAAAVIRQARELHGLVVVVPACALLRHGDQRQRRPRLSAPHRVRREHGSHSQAGGVASDRRQQPGWCPACSIAREYQAGIGHRQRRPQAQGERVELAFKRRACHRGTPPTAARGAKSRPGVSGRGAIGLTQAITLGPANHLQFWPAPRRCMRSGRRDSTGGICPTSGQRHAPPKVRGMPRTRCSLRWTRRGGGNVSLTHAAMLSCTKVGRRGISPRFLCGVPYESSCVCVCVVR